MAPRRSIAVLGSINMDLVLRCRNLPQAGETVLTDDAQEIPGGKGANQAVGAARLGANVTLLGRVGNDSHAERLLANLRAEGIETQWIQQIEDYGSGLAVVCVDDAGENSIVVVPGANGRVSPNDVEHAQEVIRKADVLLIQLEIPIPAVLHAVKIARDCGTRVVLDPAPAPQDFPEELLAVDVICPNESEAEAILGRTLRSEEDARQAAMALAKRGPTWAILTRGEKGVIACHRDRTLLTVPAFKVETVDSTAAGDAFAAALGVCLAQGDLNEEGIRMTCAAGAIAASRPGAQPSMPTWQEIDDLIKSA